MSGTLTAAGLPRYHHVRYPGARLAAKQHTAVAITTMRPAGTSSPMPEGHRHHDHTAEDAFIAYLVTPSRWKLRWVLADAVRQPRLIVSHDSQVAWRMRPVMRSPMIGSAIGTPIAMNAVDTTMPALT